MSSNGSIINQGRLMFQDKFKISKMIEGMAKDGVIPISMTSLKHEILKAHGHNLSNSAITSLVRDIGLRFKGGKTIRPLSQRPSAVLARRLQHLYIKLGEKPCEDLDEIINYKKADYSKE